MSQPSSTPSSRLTPTMNQAASSERPAPTPVSVAAAALPPTTTAGSSSNFSSSCYCHEQELSSNVKEQLKSLLQFCQSDNFDTMRFGAEFSFEPNPQLVAAFAEDHLWCVRRNGSSSDDDEASLVGGEECQTLACATAANASVNGANGIQTEEYPCSSSPKSHTNQLEDLDEAERSQFCQSAGLPMFWPVDVRLEETLEEMDSRARDLNADEKTVLEASARRGAPDAAAQTAAKYKHDAATTLAGSKRPDCGSSFASQVNRPDSDAAEPRKPTSKSRDQRLKDFVGACRSLALLDDQEVAAAGKMAPAVVGSSDHTSTTSTARRRRLAIVFHGTPESNIAPILIQGGLDPSKRHRQSYGRGEYFATDPRTSARYCRGGSMMLVFAVILPDQQLRHCCRKPPRKIVVVSESSHQFPLGILYFSGRQRQVCGNFSALTGQKQQQQRLELAKQQSQQQERQQNQVMQNTEANLLRELQAARAEAADAKYKGDIIQMIICDKLDLASKRYNRNVSALSDSSKAEISAFVHRLRLPDDGIISFYFPSLPPPSKQYHSSAAIKSDAELEVIVVEKQMAYESYKKQMRPPQPLATTQTAKAGPTTEHSPFAGPAALLRTQTDVLTFPEAQFPTTLGPSASVSATARPPVRPLISFADRVHSVFSEATTAAPGSNNAVRYGEAVLSSVPQTPKHCRKRKRSKDQELRPKKRRRVAGGCEV